MTAATDPHDRLRELVAVYALDAVDNAERGEIDAHLAGCAECRAELDGHRSTLAALAESHASDNPPGHVWEAIAAATGVPPRRARRRLPTMAAIAAAAAVVALLVGALVGRLVLPDDRDHPDLAAIASAALKAPGTRVVVR